MTSSLHTQLSECRSSLARERDALAAARANVDTLRAENARLRAALAEATATLEAWHVGNAGHMCTDPGWRVAMQDETGRQLNRARAALDGAR